MELKFKLGSGLQPVLYHIFSSSLIIQGALNNLQTPISGSDPVMEVRTNLAFLKSCKIQSIKRNRKQRNRKVHDSPHMTCKAQSIYCFYKNMGWCFEI